MAYGDSNSVRAGDPGGQAAGGIAGVLGNKTKQAVGPNDAAYGAQMNTAQKTADSYYNQSLAYNQNAPTIANQYQGQSRADIAGNVGQEQNLANTLVHNNGEASKAQFQSGLDQSLAAQMAAANSAPGGATQRAGATRAAQQQAGMQQAQGAATAAELGAREREAALGQAAGVYGQVGGQLQGQYGLEQQSAMHQADLQGQNQGQIIQARLGYGQLGNQAQGQSEQALNDYTGQSLQAQKLSQGIKESNAQDTNDIIGTVGGVLGGAASGIGALLAHGGPMHAGGAPAPATISSLYGQSAQPAAKPASLADALAGIEHLKAKIAELEARHHGG